MARSASRGAGWTSVATSNTIVGRVAGSCGGHGLEISFVFGTLDKPFQDRFAGAGPAVQGLSEQMMDAWLAFARTGNPSTPALPWPPHDAATRPTMVFDVTTEVQPAPRDAERATIDALLSRA